MGGETEFNLVSFFGVFLVQLVVDVRSFLPMPRITPLPLLLLVRVVLLVVPLFYIGLVLLWVGLPSPAGSWEKDPSARLWRGGSVVRVYDLDAFFPWNDDSPSVQDARRTGRTSFPLEYTYDRTTSALTIGSMSGSGSGSGNDASRGGGGIEVHGVTVNLVELLSLSSIDGEAAAAATPPWLSAPFSVRVKTGDQDGINLPWFAKADASLLFWEIHGDVVDLPLRWRVVREKTTAQTRGEIVVSETTVQIVPAVGAWVSTQPRQLTNSLIAGFGYLRRADIVVDPLGHAGRDCTGQQTLPS